MSSDDHDLNFSTDNFSADDGSVRFYHPPEQRAYRAVRGLSSSIADVAFLSMEDCDCMIAAGKRARLLLTLPPQVKNSSLLPPPPISQLIRLSLKPSSKLILSATDALDVYDIGEDDEDTINKVC